MGTGKTEREMRVIVPLAYVEKIREILLHLEQTQLPAVEKAADLLVAALTHGGVIYCAEIGHGIQGDFIGRAGGMAAVQAFSFKLEIADKTPRCYANRPGPDTVDRDLETVRLAVNASNLRSGDIMLLASVSGRNRVPIELALACRAKGIKAIGFTSLAYSKTVPTLHPSGKLLSETVDVVIDIGAPPGDAAVEIPGFDIKLLPVSGVAMDVAGWMIFGRVMEKMAALDRLPTVFMSINQAGGRDYHHRSLEHYDARGF